MLPLAFGFGNPVELGILMVLFVPLVFWIVELVDVTRREFPQPNLKIMWLLIIIFTYAIGALIYYFIGKRQGVLSSTHGQITPDQHDSVWPPAPKL